MNKSKLDFKFDEINHTASVIQSKRATGDVFIPRYIEHEGNNYTIISIDSDAFLNNEIESLTFDEDSEVTVFQTHSFLSTKIKKLQIPPNLKYLKPLWCQQISELIEIEVSPKNKLFSYINDKYLVGKISEKSDTFDVLHYSRFDVEEAFIPSEIRNVMEYSFYAHKKLKSIIFPENSELKRIDMKAFTESSIKKLVLPEKVEEIKNNCFSEVPNLVDFSISKKNQKFCYIDNKYLVKKSNENSCFYDSIVFARRDIESIEIPSSIRKICEYAFQNCVNLKSIKFDSNSSLEIIESSSFSHIYGQLNIVIPSSVKEIEASSFSQIKNVETIEFLGKIVQISGFGCFAECQKLKLISFPNATKINFTSGNSMSYISEETKIKIRKDAELSGPGIELIKNQIEYINSKIESPEIESKKIEKNSNDNDVISILLNHIRFLENRLSNYEKVEPFNFDKNIEKVDFEVEKFNENEEEKNVFFNDQNDEKNYKIIEKLGEGSTSIAYKVIDQKTQQTLCKKVLKSKNNKEIPFKKLQNSLKEFEVLKEISHPSICKAYSMDFQDNISSKETEKEQNEEIDYDYDFDYDYYEKTTTNKKEEKSTVSIFIEYIPYKLREMIDEQRLNNTIKARIAIEVAFGMNHIHLKGLIHRDLKIENIMLNYIFESKIIDFDLVQVIDLNDNNLSLTKGVGTLAYMSPEMQNEDDYDNKTDVYSYGVVLFVLFTGHLPKQSMKDKLNNKPIHFPRPSPSISKFCIELIKKCLSFDPKKRPSFLEILNEMKENSFQLADEIDTELVDRRYRSLNRYQAQMINNS